MQLPSPRTLLIDTDTASDDAVALIMALRSPAVRVAAITVVAGNMPLPIGLRNALYTAELCGADVPVFAGAAQPLLRPLQTAEWFHGADGISGLSEHGCLPTRAAEPLHAVDAIIDTALAHPGLEVVTLGPLTNLALALAREPRIAQRIGRCVVMGGAPCCEGNVTPAAEYNLWVDPEAAQLVMRSGLPIELVGWQLSRGAAVLQPDDLAGIAALDTPLARFCLASNAEAARGYQTQTGQPGISLPDPIAMAIALEPALCVQASTHRIEIECASELTRGMTVVDRLGVADDERNRARWSGAGRASICWQLDVPGWKAALFAALN
jgi:purine nucleosidase